MRIFSFISVLVEGGSGRHPGTKKKITVVLRQPVRRVVDATLHLEICLPSQL